jgi:hypothetical protein
LRAHYAEIEAARRDLRSTWDDIAKAAGEAGQQNARGNPPQAEGVRKAFMRLRDEMANGGRAASATRPRGQAKPASKASPPPPAIIPAVSADDGTEELDKRTQRNIFLPAKIR